MEMAIFFFYALVSALKSIISRFLKNDLPAQAPYPTYFLQSGRPLGIVGCIDISPPPL
jgi:hypothetical protein